MRKARLLVGYAAILGTLPYLTLKIAWLAGFAIGVTDPQLMQTPTMYVGNAFTGGMDFVAILVALAFTYDWGQRIPAWLVLFPIWVGTGFLAPVAVSFPMIGAELALTDGGGEGLESWVTPLVYASFAWQGCTLLTAFVLYARVRWAPLFTGFVRSGGTGVAGVIGVVLAAVTGVAHLVWMIVPIGDATPAMRFLDGVDGVLAVGAAAGVIALASVGRRFVRPLLLAWTGSAAMFSWGFWGIISKAANPDLARLVSVEALVNYGEILGGILLALALLAKARGVGAEIASERTREGALAG